MQLYVGNPAAADYTWSHQSWQWVSTGFPTNQSFTKQESSSYLDIRLNGDFTTGPAPDVLNLGLFMDATLLENIATHVAIPNSFISIAWSVIKLGIPAGPHLFDVRVVSASQGPVTFRCSTSADLTIIEVPVP